MLTLNDTLRIPEHVLFTTVEQDAILLNTSSNQYYALEEVGTRLWELLSAGKGLRESVQVLLDEYEVTPPELESDLLELLTHLTENGLVEVVAG
jgi:hypothetical protein